MSDPVPASAAGPYSIGSDHWPGLSKLIEECGEVIQVAGKIIATNGETAHWDGTDLIERLEDELADVIAAVRFVESACDLNGNTIDARAREKLRLFEQWHHEQGARLHGGVR